MHADEIAVDEVLVGRLLAAQMPELATLPLERVEPWGTDNAIWRLGDDLVVRLPRIAWAVAQVERDATFLPRLAPHLPVAVPEPVAVGAPGQGYPHPWAVHRWIPGFPAALDQMDDPIVFARDLAAAVEALGNADPEVDVQVVWSPLFTDDSRRAFVDVLHVDDDTLARSKGAAIN